MGEENIDENGDVLPGERIEEYFFLLRTRAALAICSVVQGGLADPGDDDVPSQPQTPKACEVCKCSPCVCAADEAIDRSSDVDVCNALMVCVEAELPATVRAQVLGTLWTLAASSLTDAEKLWHNRSVRKGLEKCARIGEHVDVRLSALGALWAFSACDDIRVRMWNDGEVQKVLLDSAAPEGQTKEGAWQMQLEEVRTTAFEVLANLARHTDNQVRVGVHTILAAAAEDDGIGEADRIPLCAARDR